jgi:hypothetical protein
LLPPPSAAAAAARTVVLLQRALGIGAAGKRHVGSARGAAAAVEADAHAQHFAQLTKQLLSMHMRALAGGIQQHHKIENKRTQRQYNNREKNTAHEITKEQSSLGSPDGWMDMKSARPTDHARDQRGGVQITNH